MFCLLLDSIADRGDDPADDPAQREECPCRMPFPVEDPEDEKKCGCDQHRQRAEKIRRLFNRFVFVMSALFDLGNGNTALDQLLFPVIDQRGKDDHSRSDPAEEQKCDRAHRFHHPD